MTLNIEEKGDYSIALMNEIFDSIKQLPNRSSSNSHNKLDELNSKIDYARSQGINVDSLDKQILEFRFVLFNKDYDNMLEIIKKDEDKYIFDISKLQEEYIEFKKENSLDQIELKNKMDKIQEELIRARIKFMIRNLREGEENSSFTFDKIAQEISEAKQKGINIDDIEEILFS